MDEKDKDTSRIVDYHQKELDPMDDKWNTN